MREQRPTKVKNFEGQNFFAPKKFKKCLRPTRALIRFLFILFKVQISSLYESLFFHRVRFQSLFLVLSVTIQSWKRPSHFMASGNTVLILYSEINSFYHCNTEESTTLHLIFYNLWAPNFISV
jgi:hypothetical protein